MLPKLLVNKYFSVPCLSVGSMAGYYSPTILAYKLGESSSAAALRTRPPLNYWFYRNEGEALLTIELSSPGLFPETLLKTCYRFVGIIYTLSTTSSWLSSSPLSRRSYSDWRDSLPLQELWMLLVFPGYKGWVACLAYIKSSLSARI